MSSRGGLLHPRPEPAWRHAGSGRGWRRPPRLDIAAGRKGTDLDGLARLDARAPAGLAGDPDREVRHDLLDMADHARPAAPVRGRLQPDPRAVSAPPAPGGIPRCGPHRARPEGRNDSAAGFLAMTR